MYFTIEFIIKIRYHLFNLPIQQNFLFVYFFELLLIHLNLLNFDSATTLPLVMIVQNFLVHNQDRF